MKKIDDIKLGKFISLILRHDPSIIKATLDKYGWIEVDKLIDGIKLSGSYIDMNILERIVNENNKNRYSFNKDKTKIRANQGHSINVDIELKIVEPPQILYHGTAERFIESIAEKGIIKGNRQYVHLSADKETAINVGKRHGVPVVLLINTKEMLKDGIVFYLSENGVWLCNSVPYKYIIKIEKNKNYK